MPKKRVLLEAVAYAVLGVFLLLFFFRQIVGSHFDLMVGDVGDARFNGVILEHWWLFATGKASWLNPDFFFPSQGVLGYSDASFLTAVPYSLARLSGFSPNTSHQLVLFFLPALGWFGSVYFLRRCLRLSFLSSALGATLFVFPNAMANSLGHTQLVAVYYLPPLAIASFSYIKSYSAASWHNAISGAFVAIVFPLLLFTSYYVGWFAAFFVLLFLVVLFVRAGLKKGPAALWQSVRWASQQWKRLLPFLVLALLCLLPFLVTYLPILKVVGPRPFSEILPMLPSPVDFINVGTENWFWGSLFAPLWNALQERPLAWELYKGLPFLLVAFFLVVVVLNGRAWRGLEVLSSRQEKLSLAVILLGVTILLASLLMVKLGGFSLWELVTQVVPGAGAIRAVFRFEHVLAFPLAIVVSIGLDQLFQALRGSRRPVLRVGAPVAFGLIAALLVLENGSKQLFAAYSKNEQNEVFSRIGPPPAGTKILVASPEPGSLKPPHVSQIDAVIVAQKFGLKTVNGYSGGPPPGWAAIGNTASPTYLDAVASWLRQKKVPLTGVSLLNLATGEWSPIEPSLPAEPPKEVLMTGPLSDADFAVHLSVEREPSDWTANELRRLPVRVRNDGHALLSRFGADPNDPLRYTFALAYRWKGKDGGPLTDFGLRFYLPGALTAGQESVAILEVRVPPQAGRYTLEVEAVQEFVAWFKDKGSPGLSIPLEVR